MKITKRQLDMEFKNRFLKIVTKSGVSFAAISFGCLLPYMSLAASSNGCDDLDKNDSINPEIALCSTHVYNIKAVTNPDSNTAKSQLMKDVVALKSTIIMQQMYKQYEYLEATISRLKTQLRREILTSKLETAGASSSSSSSSSSSKTSTVENNGVAGAENCITAGLTADVMSCLSRNLDRITSAINSSDIGAAQRQIKTDIEVLRMYDKLEKTQDDLTTKDKQETNGMSVPLYNAYKECQNAFNTNNRTSMTSCINLMRVCVTQNIEAMQTQNRTSSQIRYY